VAPVVCCLVVSAYIPNYIVNFTIITVTNQKIRCKNLQKFKTFCLNWSATNFQPKLLALSYILH
jgi:hypothetical protein